MDAEEGLLPRDDRLLVQRIEVSFEVRNELLRWRRRKKDGLELRERM